MEKTEQDIDMGFVAAGICTECGNETFAADGVCIRCKTEQDEETAIKFRNIKTNLYIGDECG